MTEGALLAPLGSGWIAARDPRLRILAATLFALITIGLDHLPVALLAFALALSLALTAGIRPGFLLRRLAALEGFMAILLLSLPFTVPGHAIAEIGPLAASREGLHLAGLILLKANTVVLTLTALIGTLEPVVFGHALARLGVPEKLVHLLLMTIRQIHLLHQEYLRLRQAMRARAFVPRSDRHTWNSYGWLMGMLLVRSLDRAQRVMAAMRCRGFRGRLYLLDQPRWRIADSGSAAGFMILCMGLPILDRIM
ncbi:cobalt ECF transporter T component CbiQ [Imhoffiella purpurea]|uniref:Transmembrane component NikQ of energizing module of nickel ECF transporter n=1 Tax=Imhoffiella purpurea TaxID=1249627 RepID=W9V684_9GAMM|nr:cobalt ECF transporter T component CbiQ [Imhoffiella purpurea]EXJ15073.1 Transmembrane component NikQ of energizing module of nickel ECF transporter [Imhoffiella purpurea]